MSKTQRNKPARGAKQANNEHAVALNAYREAFGSRYPTYRVEFKPTKGDKYFVLLNGDKGDIALDINDIREATANLLH